MKEWAIVDLDGTLCDTRLRVHFADAARTAKTQDERNRLWDNFHRRCAEDAPVEGVASLVRAWYKAGNGVVYLTGRTEPWRAATLTWLRAHKLPNLDCPLYMRAANDWAHSTEFKMESYMRIVESLGPNTRVAFALEDADRLVKMWRTIGVCCLQVGVDLS
jgi:beta-phosphoglucomutase-like phosphatase (HAD superfamily)